MRAITHARYVRVARPAFIADRDRYWQQLCAASPASAAWWRAWEAVAKCNAALAELDEPGDSAREQESPP